MKKMILLLSLMTSCTLAQTNAFRLPEGLLTLPQARRIALENNPGINRAVNNIEAAQAMLKQISALKYPGITASAKYTRTNVDVQPEWAPEMRYEDSLNSYSAGIEAHWLLFDGFSRRANILSSRYAVEQSEKLHMEVRRILLDAVTAAYVQSQLAIESMAIAAQDLQFNRMLEGESQERYTVGTIPESELLNFSVHALQAEIRFIHAKRNYQIACLVLARLMAVPEIKLTDEMRPARFTGMMVSELPTFKEEFDYALLHRPDLLALDIQCRILQQQIHAKKGSYAPQVNMIAGINYAGRDDMDSVDVDNYDNYVGIAVAWDIFSGGRNKGEVQEATARLSATQESYNELYLQIQSNIRQTLATAYTAFKIYERSSKACELTVRIRNSVEKSYKAGAAPLTRLNEAQTDLTRATGAVASSRVQYLQALEKLDAETGRILTETQIAPR